MVVFSSVPAGFWPFEDGEVVSKDLVERVQVDIVIGVVVEFSAFAAGKTTDRYVFWKTERNKTFVEKRNNGFDGGFAEFFLYGLFAEFLEI